MTLSFAIRPICFAAITGAFLLSACGTPTPVSEYERDRAEALKAGDRPEAGRYGAISDLADDRPPVAGRAQQVKYSSGKRLDTPGDGS